MKRITVSYDDQPEDAIEAIEELLKELGIKYTKTEEDTDIHIDYEDYKTNSSNIARIKVQDLKKDDVLVISYIHPLTQNEIEHCKNSIKLLGIPNEVLVIGNGAEVSIVSPVE